MVIKKMFGLLVIFLACSVFVSASESGVVGNDCVDSVPLYRFWNADTGDHFYTIGESERAKVEDFGWTYEGIVGYAFSGEEMGTIPVYRFWNGDLKDHFYTTSESERAKLLMPEWNDWVYEGIVFYVYEDERVNGLPIYRFWNSINSNHVYITDEGERDKLEMPMWKNWVYEGVMGYSCKDNVAPSKVSNLRDVDIGENWILWNWVNPSDDDFYLNLVYLDGVNVINTSDGFYNASGLNENTSYVLKILTMDDSYNINCNGVFDSAKTLAVENSDNENDESDENNESDGNDGGDDGIVVKKSYVVLKSSNNGIKTTKVVDYSVENKNIVLDSIKIDSSGAIMLDDGNVSSVSKISWVFWIMLIVVVILFLIVVGVGIRR